VKLTTQPTKQKHTQDIKEKEDLIKEEKVEKEDKIKEEKVKKVEKEDKIKEEKVEQVIETPVKKKDSPVEPLGSMHEPLQLDSLHTLPEIKSSSKKLPELKETKILNSSSLEKKSFLEITPKTSTFDDINTDHIEGLENSEKKVTIKANDLKQLEEIK